MRIPMIQETNPTNTPMSVTPPDGQPAERQKRRTLWSASDLLAHEFPEPRWAVPGILPEGLTLLAGPPKVGKSWLSLNLALAVATGSKALDTVDVEQGRVLYLALEDTPRRLQKRLETCGAAGANLENLAFAVEWPPMPTGGQEMLDHTLGTQSDVRLVIVDVLAKVRGRDNNRANLYEADYAAMNILKTVADRHQVAVCVIHHVRKAASDDFLDTISGTHGLAGAADTIAVLRRARSRADAVLHTTGRDIEENNHPLTFNPHTGTWTLLDGTPEEYEMSDTRRAVLEAVRTVGAATPKSIADATALPYDVVKQTCSRMAKSGHLTRTPSGSYAAVDFGRSL